jgi:hypothetical protein
VRHFRAQQNALAPQEFDALRRELLESPLVGDSTLAGPFEASRGFSAVFRAEGKPQLTKRFPSLIPWLELASGLPAVEALRPWWKRRLEAVPNAWYLNVLLVAEGGSVAPHFDTTLRKLSGDDSAFPVVVSVLYLRVPSNRGGELVLWEHSQEVKRLAPAENASIHFRGDLLHQVRPFQGGDGLLRASLVLEQYQLSSTALSRLPEFRLESRAGFDSYLKHHHQQTGPRASFESEL